MPTLKPRKIWDRITPELPRAPISAPCAARLAMAERSGSSSPRMSSTADCSVKSMLVPVSPSGTGKTLSASTSSRLIVSQASEPSRASLNSWPSHSVMGMVGAPVRVVVSAAADVDALDVDVDLDHGQTQGALHRIADGVREVVCDFRDPRAVLDDDIERDGDAVLPDFDLDATMQLVAVQPLGEAVAQPAGGHRDHAIASGGRVAGDGGDDVARHFDPPEVSGLDQRPRRLPGAQRVGLRSEEH